MREVGHLRTRAVTIRRRETPSATDLSELVDESLSICATLVGELARAQDMCQRAQEDLRAESEGWQRLVQRIPVAWLSIDLRGVIVDANASAATLLNVSLKHLRGRVLLHFAEDRDGFEGLLQTVGTGTDVTSESFRLRPRDRAPQCVTASIFANTTVKTTRIWCLFSAATGPVRADRRALRNGAAPE